MESTVTPSEVKGFEGYLKSIYDVELDLHHVKDLDLVKVVRILVPNDSRGAGIGSKVMQEIVDFADDLNLVVSLTPSKDFGASSISRLNKFYGKFGFKRNNDPTYADMMVRKPKNV